MTAARFALLIFLSCSMNHDKLFAATLMQMSQNGGHTYQKFKDIDHRHLYQSLCNLQRDNPAKELPTFIPELNDSASNRFITKRQQNGSSGRNLLKRRLAKKMEQPWYNGRTGRREIRAKHKINSFKLLVDTLKKIKRRGILLRRR